MKDHRIVLVPTGLIFTNITLATIVVAVLFLGRKVIVPVVLALFLTFVLAPPRGIATALASPALNSCIVFGNCCVCDSIRP